jgi:hypothetical protein
MMQHQAGYGIQGKDANNKSMMAFVQSMILAHDVQQAGRVGLTLEQFRAKIHDDMWLWGLNNITEKTADREGLVRCDSDLVKKHEQIKVDTMFGAFNVEVNKCPLITKVYSVAQDKRVLVLSVDQIAKQDKILKEFLDARDPREMLKAGRLEAFISERYFVMAP